MRFIINNNKTLKVNLYTKIVKEATKYVHDVENVHLACIINSIDYICMNFTMNLTKQYYFDNSK